MLSRPALVAAYAACALIWGTTWYAIRVCIAPGGYPTIDALALRFLLATVALAPLAIRARPWPRGPAWRGLVFAGLLDALGYALVYFGEERVPGGLAAVVYGTQPLVLAILLGITRVERMTKRQLAGAVVSLAGVGVLFVDRLAVSSAQAVGVALVLLSVVVSTAYSMVMKRHGEGVSGVVSTWIFLAVTAAALGAAALALHPALPWPLPAKPTLALVYLGLVGSVAAFLSYFWLLGQTSLVTVSTLVFVFPLVALATDALFEHALVLGWHAYVGAGITLGGLAVTLRRG